MKKLYPATCYGSSMNLYLKKGRYENKDRLFIQSYDSDGFPWATLSINIPEFNIKNENCALIDIMNCFWAPTFLEQNNIAKPTGRSTWSGYPEYEFNTDILKEINEFRK